MKDERKRKGKKMKMKITRTIKKQRKYEERNKGSKKH